MVLAEGLTEVNFVTQLLKPPSKDPLLTESQSARPI